MEKIALYFVGAITVGAFWFAMVEGADKQAVVDCYELQKQAEISPQYNPKTHVGFFISNWQAEECASVHIVVPAPTL